MNHYGVITNLFKIIILLCNWADIIDLHGITLISEC
jgi:hypothetical protein